ncbi:TPA: hypothetical protein I7730_00570 [Vibrio vulnificus]|uniref:Uncharacterized protein n=1 Tax=Vibrio vulnificus TaxID=672 RepID=A0A8H9K6Z4_VIBVL|nr:hypothetical protein [Vibrio vulnificus]HAS8538292.1 hypothetical protein [Vibrio vulnificus]
MNKKNLAVKMLATVPFDGDYESAADKLNVGVKAALENSAISNISFNAMNSTEIDVVPEDLPICEENLPIPTRLTFVDAPLGEHYGAEFTKEFSCYNDAANYLYEYVRPKLEPEAEYNPFLRQILDYGRTLEGKLLICRAYFSMKDEDDDHVADFTITD